MTSLEVINLTSKPGEDSSDDANRHIIVTNRYVHTSDDIENHYAKADADTVTCRERICSSLACSRDKVLHSLLSVLPIINVIRTYKIREYAIGDVLSGLTTSCLHLPQGLAYGILSDLGPAYGLYTTFFPIVLYLFFGTSAHVSFGTNAVIALVSAEIINAGTGVSTGCLETANVSDTLEVNMTAMGVLDLEHERKVAATATMTFCVGVILVILGVLRLGFVTSYLSASFIGGFAAAAAVHIASSQVPKALGIKVGVFRGPGKLIFFYIDIFRNIGSTNVAAIVMTLICIVILLLIKVCINERFKDKLKVPIPIDLILIIIATIISYFANFGEHFKVKLLGEIPSGLPAPTMPDLQSVGDVIGDAFIVAILVFSLTISMAKLCGRLHNYEVDDNQELIAYGVANFGGSFFKCFPSCVALTRTMLLSSMGAKTTLNGAVSAIFILIVLLAAGPLFMACPVPVLAAMIIVSVRKLLTTVADLPKIYKVNPYDCMTWIITSLAGILIDIHYGLVCGIGWSLLSVVLQSQLSKSYALGKANTEDRYLSAKRREHVNEVPGVKIFRMEASLYFATAELFRKRLYESTVNPKDVKEVIALVPSQNEDSDSKITENTADDVIKGHAEINDNAHTIPLRMTDMTDSTIVQYIVLDCMPINYVDMNGVNMLKFLFAEFRRVGITILLARCTTYMHRVLEGSEFYENVSRGQVFADIDDAMEHVSIELKKNAS